MAAHTPGREGKTGHPAAFARPHSARARGPCLLPLPKGLSAGLNTAWPGRRRARVSALLKAQMLPRAPRSRTDLLLLFPSLNVSLSLGLGTFQSDERAGSQSAGCVAPGLPAEPCAPLRAGLQERQPCRRALGWRDHRAPHLSQWGHECSLPAWTFAAQSQGLRAGPTVSQLKLHV